MSLETQLTALATRAGQESKALRTLINNNVANLSGLNTTAKTSLVAAVNEVLAAVSGAGATINDSTTSGSSVWSSSKTETEIAAAVNAVIDGAPGAIDTLNELAAAIGDDANFAATVTTALSNRLRFDAAQTLSGPQQLQACTNIGVGDPEADFEAAFEAALV